MADDNVDVKIRADAGQASDAMTKFADTTEGSSERIMAALAELAARSEITAARFSSAMDEMSARASESSAMALP